MKSGKAEGSPDAAVRGHGAPRAGAQGEEAGLRQGIGAGRLALIIVPGLGPLELVLIVLALLLIFGAKRIPQIARGLGEGIRDFKRSLSGPNEDEKSQKRLEGGKEDDD